MSQYVLYGYLIILFFQYSSWKNNRAIIHDATSYYGYLPATFIFKDLSFKFADSLPVSEPTDLLWYSKLPNGQRFQKMTVGLAYFYSPTFFIAHIYTYFDRNWNRNGFSFPYQLALAFNTLLVGIFSIFLMRRILNHFFQKNLTALLLIVCFAATNLGFYISVSPGTSHIYSFLLICILLLTLIKFKSEPKLSSLILIFFSISLIVLVRPTNAIFAVALFFVVPPKEIMVVIIKGRFRSVIIFVAILAPWLLQLVYWKAFTGHWLYYSYGNEGFFFSDPKVWEGIFGFRKGWLVYSPALLIIIPALFFNLKQLRPIRLFVIFTIPVFVFVVFSWWCWWYGGSFGSRTMIEYYPFVILLIGGLIERVSQKKVLIAAIIVFWGFSVYLNNFQIRQYQKGILHWDSMTYDAYKAIFLNNNLPANYEQLLDRPDYNEAMKGNGR